MQIAVRSAQPVGSRSAAPTSSHLNCCYEYPDSKRLRVREAEVTSYRLPQETSHHPYVLMLIANPKRASQDRNGYPYYAGFSAAFVESTLASWGLPRSAVVLDPWNGSGTTTAVASGMGYSSVGVDLNPVAVTLARGRLLDPAAADSLLPLSEELIEEASCLRGNPYRGREPLLHWFHPVTARRIRRFEMAVQRILVDRDRYHVWSSDGTVEKVSSLASFHLTALFLLVRELLSDTKGSNPTWIRRLSVDDRLRISFNMTCPPIIGPV